MDRCKKCGGYRNDPMRLGSGRRGPDCSCASWLKNFEDKAPRKSAQARKSTSRLSTAEQLAVLAKLFKEGALSEQEFRILKAKLIAGGD
jgi:hypothetical protein